MQYLRQVLNQPCFIFNFGPQSREQFLFNRLFLLKQLSFLKHKNCQETCFSTVLSFSGKPYFYSYFICGCLGVHLNCYYNLFYDMFIFWLLYPKSACYTRPRYLVSYRRRLQNQQWKGLPNWRVYDPLPPTPEPMW